MFTPNLAVSAPHSPETTDEPSSASDRTDSDRVGMVDADTARSDRGASPTRSQAQHLREPNLIEMLDDPLIQTRMARAGATRETILALMTTVRPPVAR
jgi:hypothetical protein